MCVVSNVHDTWDPIIPHPTFPDPLPWPTAPKPTRLLPWAPLPTKSEPLTPEELRTLLKLFGVAVEVARQADAITGQPDCLDPEKAKLRDRVAELERRLDKIESETKTDPAPPVTDKPTPMDMVGITTTTTFCWPDSVILNPAPSTVVPLTFGDAVAGLSITRQ